LHILDPPKSLFTGVGARMPVALLEIHGGPHRRAGDAPGTEVAVGLEAVDADIATRTWVLTADMPRLVNPNTGTVPLFGSATDAAIVTAVHARVPVLIRREPGDVDGADGADGADNPWGLRMVSPLHMTRDAVHFRPAPGPGLVPLVEAKHAALLDHRGGRADYRYWVPRELMLQRYGDLCARGWLAGYRNVATATSARTLLPCALPVFGVGNSLPLLSAPRLPLLLAALASLPVDYSLRQKHAGANVNFFKLEQVPVPPPRAYDVPAPWQPGTTIERWVLERFAIAVPADPAMPALGVELARSGVAWPALAPSAAGGRAIPAKPDARALALADLDAVHAFLLGLDRAEVEHILSTFTALADRERRTCGRFVTAERVLSAYDALGAAPCGPRGETSVLSAGRSFPTRA
jgi:hypothetical protein